MGHFDDLQIVVRLYQLRHMEAEDLGYLGLSEGFIDGALAQVELLGVVGVNRRAILLAHMLGDIYSAMDAEAKPLGEAQVVPGSVGGGMRQSDVTH